MPVDSQVETRLATALASPSAARHLIEQINAATGCGVTKVAGRIGDITLTPKDVPGVLTPDGDASKLKGITIEQVAGLVQLLAQLATLDSPPLFGTPTTPTAPFGTDTDQVASCKFVQQNGGAGAIKSIFGRTGEVKAEAGDYDVSQVTGALAEADLDGLATEEWVAGQHYLRKHAVDSVCGRRGDVKLSLEDFPDLGTVATHAVEEFLRTDTHQAQAVGMIGASLELPEVPHLKDLGNVITFLKDATLFPNLEIRLARLETKLNAILDALKLSGLMAKDG
jgi:hypothetical protein